VKKPRARIWTVVFTASALLAVMALQAASALASSGEITHAEASADWTQGRIAGSATWGGCENGEASPPDFGPLGGPSVSSGCSLQPYLTVGTSECSSGERGWPHSNDKLTLAWSGTEMAGGGSASFDVSEVPLSGEPGQLACLTLLETYEERPYCQIHPEPGVACPMWIMLVQNPVVLDEAPLTQGSTPPTEPEDPECLIEPWECGEEEPESCPGESGRYIVVFEDWVEDPAALAHEQVAKYGGKLGFVYTHALKGYSAQFPVGAVAALEGEPSVKYVEEDQVVEAFGTSTSESGSADVCGVASSEEPPTIKGESASGVTPTEGSAGVQSSSTVAPSSTSPRRRHRHRHHGRSQRKGDRRGHKRHRLQVELGRAGRVGQG
jgi:hypothetical protein